ncbi:MAG: ATP-binding protein [Desulfatiglans sp.]|jgi:predicted HTH transcriptional regulator|nr:ATP-binding protein [Desulfatiglans sp.]
MTVRVFISSVQKELEPERLALFSLLTTDPTLKDYVEPVLFEQLSPPPRPTKKPYLKTLKACQVYILMLDREYAPDGITTSATHEEYDLACSMGIPALAMIKGRHDTGRDPRTQAFFKTIKNDGFTYKRFIDRIDLKKEVAGWLIQVLKNEFGIEPQPSQEESSEDTIEAASAFETTQQDDLLLSDLDVQAARELYAGFTGKFAKSMNMATMSPVFRVRGLLWRDSDTANLQPTAAGIVFLGKNPWQVYAQCQVLADAYRDTRVTAKPMAQAKFSGPITRVLEELLQFVDSNTAHPTRVVGINNIELDEYPRRAVREALVNAFAHRTYEDTSRKIRLEIFRDRLVVSSPGYPPRPLTLAKLRRGKYESCRRNPVIAECLAALDMMEQRGTGFERIRAAMQDHGLSAHKLDQRDGYFKVILPGPDGDFDRLRTPADVQGLIPPSVESRLNDRQKQIMVQVQTEGSVTSGWCRKTFGVTYNTAYLDLSNLVDRGLLVQRGKGRGTRYELLRERA